MKITEQNFITQIIQGNEMKRLWNIACITTAGW